MISYQLKVKISLTIDIGDAWDEVKDGESRAPRGRVPQTRPG